jgi:ribulose-bisphosphate carboxylase large chain
MIPGITGFDSMVQLAKDDEFALPIIAHPALLGSHVRAGFSHQVLFGTLCRLAGADASIFPNYGGRFGFSQVGCPLSPMTRLVGLS